MTKTEENVSYTKLKDSMVKAIENNPADFEAYNDLFALCRECENERFDTAHVWNHELRSTVVSGLLKSVNKGDLNTAEKFNDLLFRSLIFGAPHFFDDYLQAVEFGKPLDKEFYKPRRHYLKRYVDAYQEVLD